MLSFPCNLAVCGRILGFLLSSPPAFSRAPLVYDQLSPHISPESPLWNRRRFSPRCFRPTRLSPGLPLHPSHSFSFFRNTPPPPLLLPRPSVCGAKFPNLPPLESLQMSGAWRWNGRLPAAQMHLRLFAIVMSLFCEVIRMGSGIMQKQSGE